MFALCIQVGMFSAFEPSSNIAWGLMGTFSYTIIRLFPFAKCSCPYFAKK